MKKINKLKLFNAKSEDVVQLDKIITQIKLLSLVSIFSLLFLFNSCSSDNTENLGNGYFYRNEGGQIKDILCESSNGCEIPATVLDYVYDKKFIIAKQKPDLSQDPLYDKTYTYPNGIDKFYYWLIIKDSNIVFGPLSITELDSIKNKYNVPLARICNPSDNYTDYKKFPITK